MLGLRERRAHRAAAHATACRAGSPERRELERVCASPRWRSENLDLTDDILAAVERADRRQQDRSRAAPRVPLTTFAAAVAVALSLMFVAVLLAAGVARARALGEHVRAAGAGPAHPARPAGREDAARRRLRGRWSRLLMLLGLGMFIPLEWGRFPLWLVGADRGAAAFAAMGPRSARSPGRSRRPRCWPSRCCCRVAFLALVPSGVVSAALYDFSARRLGRCSRSGRRSSHELGALRRGRILLGPLLHLLALALAFGLAARAALRASPELEAASQRRK